MIHDLDITHRAAEQLANAKERYRKAVADVDRRAREMHGKTLRNKANGHLYRCSARWPDERHALFVSAINPSPDTFTSGLANPCEFEIVEDT